MLELIKELSKLSGLISRLFFQEKNPISKKDIMKLLAMVNEKLELAGQNRDIKIGKDFFQPVINNMKAADPLIKEILGKNKTYPDLFDHIKNLVNDLDELFSRLGIKADTLSETQPPGSGNR